MRLKRLSAIAGLIFSFGCSLNQNQKPAETRQGMGLDTRGCERTACRVDNAIEENCRIGQDVGSILRQEFIEQFGSNPFGFIRIHSAKEKICIRQDLPISEVARMMNSDGGYRGWWHSSVCRLWYYDDDTCLLFPEDGGFPAPQFVNRSDAPVVWRSLDFDN